MNRRNFIKIWTAVAASLGLPVTATAALTGSSSPELAAGTKVTRIRIGLRDTANLRSANRTAREAGIGQPWPDPPDDGTNYWAEAIQSGNQYFYRVGDTTLDIVGHEYAAVIANPNLYYFSKALNLHLRVQRKRDGVPDPV